MPVLSVESHLNANLAALGKRNADVAEKLASTQPSSSVFFAQTQQGVLAASLAGKWLCSRHRPLDEAFLLVKDIDLVEHAVVVVLGFGVGYHVQKLAERADKATLIIVYEPDLQLLRAVFEQIDHSGWMRDALLLLITDAQDRGTLARKLDGAESILAQGMTFLEHPPSRLRLGVASTQGEPAGSDGVWQFTQLLTDHVTAAKTTLTTTLLRSVDTVRNLLLNMDHYALGAGLAELQNVAAGYPAVVVAAGPSLHKNMHLLGQSGVRERCVIIAVQTALKPLLAAGIKPHFVTALDYHEISGRFYEGLTEDDVRGITLIADPKAHPVILDSFPDQVRCCSSDVLDRVLGGGEHIATKGGAIPGAKGGGLKRPMGDLPAGATVAHLAFSAARFLGCNPIAMIGQDLGFTDGLYYSPGAAIHDVWAPELNPFNTIEMMEWQRIVRHRLHLRKARDVHGRTIYTDAQMQTYLQQFERDFGAYVKEGLTIVDATEGGVKKQHAVSMPLNRYLQEYAQRVLPAFPRAESSVDASRAKRVRQRLAQVRADIRAIQSTSRKTAALLRQMMDDQHDQSRMAEHFRRMERYRKDIEQRMEAFELLNNLNQLGVFKRFKADRRLHMQSDLDPMARQRAQLERDLENVIWIADAAQEMIGQLAASERLLAGQSLSSKAGVRLPARPMPNTSGQKLRTHQSSSPSRIAALVPIDPERNALGIPRSLAEEFGGRSVFQATLERLGESTRLQSIILIAPKNAKITCLIDCSKIKLPVEVEWCDGSPFGLERRAIGAARRWAETCWRGGIAGLSIYDEVLCPRLMHDVMQRRGLTASLIVGPDWPFVNVTGSGGCDDVIARHLEHPDKHNLVFTQSPPGLCGCVISAALMAELSLRNRLSTVGGLLVYQPHAPQHDPIAREANVQIDHQVRRSLIRATFDSPRQRDLIRAALGSRLDERLSTQDIVRAIEGISPDQACGFAPVVPQHLTLELCTSRVSRGLLAQQFAGANRAPISLALVQRMFLELGQSADTVLNLAGAGDPLLHPQFDQIIRAAKSSGVAAIHIRTELLCDRETLDRLLACDVDVISVDLHADRATTYHAMMGLDGESFKNALLNIEYLIKRRSRLTNHGPTACFAVPWVVPRLQRCAATYEDIDSFYDRWQHTLGTAVIEGPLGQKHEDSLTPAVTPPRVLQRDWLRHMTIFSDGCVPVDDRDWPGQKCIGDAHHASITELWSTLLGLRRETRLIESEVAA